MPTSPTVTAARFDALQAKLRELFELDKSDLDFGIYRIIAAKNREVTDFLERKLKDVVAATLADHGAGAADAAAAELDEAIAQARSLGADPDSLPKVRELREKLDSAGGQSAAELEADIYNHLLAFFSRYYDEGDFLSKRRYKGDTYAIPYSGEEVTLHWANKDQYYIKSGEWHKDYRFRVGSHGATEPRSDGDKSGSMGVPPVRTVRFRLVEATAEAGNNKEPAESKRRYILTGGDPLAGTDRELTLNFEFRAPSDEEKRRAAQATSLFGGDYAKKTGAKKGDEREQFCADAEGRILAALRDGESPGEAAAALSDGQPSLSADQRARWASRLSAPAPTAGKPARTILGKHLDHFTARNTFDYFIHKDLGGFLARELDFYIKNEVVRLDDLEELPADQLARVQGKVKAIRAVARPVIDFLAAIENFQKRLWLKKKFVLECNWLVTIDRIPGTSHEATGTSHEATEPRSHAGCGTGVPPVRSGSHRRPVTEAGAPVTVGRAPAMSELEPATGDDEPVTHEREPVTNEREPVKNAREPVRGVASPGGIHSRAGANRAEPSGNRAAHAGGSTVENAKAPKSQNAQAGAVARDSSPTPHASSPAQDLRQLVADNPRQWAEWERLGFRPAEEESLLARPAWGTRAYLEAHPGLVVDTALFDGDFKARLLASERVLAGKASLDEATTGLLIHGENFGALNLLQSRYREQVKCVYIDPPYNTGGDGFAYKDQYMHSSWGALLLERLAFSKSLMTSDSAMFVSIDDGEQAYLRGILEIVFNPKNFLANIIWQKKYAPQNDALWFSDDHDFLIAFAQSKKSWFPRKLPRTAEQDSAYSNPDNDPRGPWKGGDYTCAKSAEERPNLFYPITHPNTGQELYPSRTRVWAYSREEHERHVAENRISWGRSGTANMPAYKRFLSDMEGRVPQTIWQYKDVGHNQDGFRDLAAVVPNSNFPSPKPAGLVRRILHIADASTVLDYFAGSGTTGHAVINLNREDSGERKFILVEMGAYFHTVLKPRIAKVLYCPDWKEGRAQTHHQGTSALVKYFALESYEDALNNLPAPAGGLLDGVDDPAREALLAYSLDLELGPRLLDLAAFRDPWNHAIHAQPAGADEIRPHRVDLVETFNYLLGLKVKTHGPLERYAADFVRADHADGLGQLKVSGRLRRDPAGPYVFQRVEGDVNDADGTRVLVIWRRLTDDAEKDAAVLQAWMDRHREDTRERTDYREYHRIYVNGPVTLPQPTQEIRTVFPTEETFKDRMFEGAEAGGAA